jgi:hypothetical protein
MLSAEGSPTDSGNYMIDHAGHVCKQNVTLSYEIVVWPGICGGLWYVLRGRPRDPKIGPYVKNICAA